MSMRPCVFSPVASPIIEQLQLAKPDWHFVETSQKESFASLLRAHFVAQKPIVMIGAVAIVLRVLAPLIRNKHAEPPVIVISPDAMHIIPILGGHHGANKLANEIAITLDAQVVISNASTLEGDPLQSIPHDWVVADPQKLDNLRKSLANKEHFHIHSDCFIAQIPFASTTHEEPHVTITDKQAPRQGMSGVVIHPPTLTLGMGFVRHADVDTVTNFVYETLQQHNIAPQSIAAVASIDLKRFEPALHAIACKFEIPLRVFDADTLQQIHKRYNLADNPVVYDAVGVHSVADAAALALASSSTCEDAYLVLKKQTHPLATLAVASASTPFKHQQTTTKGSACGVLHVIGTGPGDYRYLTNDAIQALHECSVIVGYSLYIDLVKPYLAEKTIHAFPLGKERDRVIKALSCAEEGYSVGLVCSGDPGIYAMASLVFEEMEHNNNKLPVIVHPGISAMVMASAKFGAILGHDFCAISLSDLLTPRKVIVERVTHAAKGDFVVAFYNPQSLERRSLLKVALSIIKEHRSPETPVAVAWNLTRADERLTLTPLSDFCPEDVDMFSIVLVGNSQSRSIEHIPLTTPAVYTPRGY